MHYCTNISTLYANVREYKALCMKKKSWESPNDSAILTVFETLKNIDFHYPGRIPIFSNKNENEASGIFGVFSKNFSWCIGPMSGTLFLSKLDLPLALYFTIHDLY